jgi:phosphatidate cytidylyltransferase
MTAWRRQAPPITQTGEAQTSRRVSELWPRVASAVVLAGAALTVTWLGGAWFAAFWLLAAVAILWEWLNLVGGPGRLALFGLGAAALALAAALAGRAAPPLAVLLVLLAALAAAVLSPTGRRLWRGAGILYAGAAIVPIVALRNSASYGVESVLWLFAVVWATDSMAFIGGRLIGGPKLWPRISPSKTWSGFTVGIVSGALAGLAIVRPAPAGLPFILCLGLASAAIAQAGDLAESSVKRHFGVKDSSQIIPGHGGVMDRLDGFLAASTFAFLIGGLRADWSLPAYGLFR